jgi:hypothetical protein
MFCSAGPWSLLPSVFASRSDSSASSVVAISLHPACQPGRSLNAGYILNILPYSTCHKVNKDGGWHRVLWRFLVSNVSPRFCRSSWAALGLRARKKCLCNSADSYCVVPATRASPGLRGSPISEDRRSFAGEMKSFWSLLNGVPWTTRADGIIPIASDAAVSGLVSEEPRCFGYSSAFRRETNVIFSRQFYPSGRRNELPGSHLLRRKEPMSFHD